MSLSADTEVAGIVFNDGASAFTISPDLRVLLLTGAGIMNNSGITQNFAVLFGGGGASGSVIRFRNSATAGNGTRFTTSSTSSFIGGRIAFRDSSSAGRGTFINNPSMDSNVFTSGQTVFHDNSTAANGTFTNNGGAMSGASGGFMRFSGRATAGNGTFVNNGGKVSGAGGGDLRFVAHSTADNAELIANGGLSAGAFGGRILFEERARGGMARVELFGNAGGDFTDGNLNLSDIFAPSVTIGSLEGNGTVFLESNRLIVGSNNLSTTFAGVIRDGGIRGGTGGALSKIGRGTLFLTHANTYTGGTIIERGKLVVNNTSGSGTGTGPVDVNHGRLGGTGIIAGAVVLGTGIGHGAVLSPGPSLKTDNLGTLTIQSTLNLNSDGSYHFGLNSSSARSDKVVARGVRISSAQFFFADFGAATLPAGTVFTVIKNTAGTPIAGTFINLADGSTFTSNGNTYKVSYEGGDGNDLTLTVVP